MTGRNPEGATVMVAPLGANPADPSAWTDLGQFVSVQLDDGLTYETTVDVWNTWGTDTVPIQVVTHHVPEPRYPSCVYPDFTAVLTQKGDSSGLPSRRD